MIGTTLLRPSNILAATAIAGCVLGMTPAFADVPQVVVEATAPVQHTSANAGADRVDMLSVKYHVHMQGLDLTKHADVLQAEEQVKVAATKACEAIQVQYPTRPLSDQKSCISDATSRGMGELKLLIATAEKNSTSK